MKIKKGDNVKVISGKDRLKTGTVVLASPDGARITVDNLNMFKKRSKPKKQGEKGQMVLVPRPLNVSKVMLICPNCKNPTRVGYRVEGSRKVRYCKKCKSNI